MNGREDCCKTSPNVTPNFTYFLCNYSNMSIKKKTLAQFFLTERSPAPSPQILNHASINISILKHLAHT